MSYIEKNYDGVIVGITAAEIVLNPRLVPSYSDSQILNAVKQAALDQIEYQDGLAGGDMIGVPKTRSPLERRRRIFNKKKPRLAIALAQTKTPSCAICGRLDDLSIDHIIPMSRGGDDSVSNLQWLCRNHNSVKGCK